MTYFRIQTKENNIYKHLRFFTRELAEHWALSVLPVKDGVLEVDIETSTKE